MDAAHLVMRMVLGGVFVIAGASKIASGPRWIVQAGELGVPRPIARYVPWFELVLGAVVAVGLASPWDIVVATGVLVLFTGVLVRTLSLGRRPPCACFGAWTAAPLGWGQVGRNVALVALGLGALLSR